MSASAANEPQVQPRLVTWADLYATLLPLCLGWSWAEDAIRDLWLKGAPVPVRAGTPETRILLPGQFRQWFAEVRQRQGLAQTPEDMYGQIARGFKTSERG
jgi:hypothetical protein